METETDGVIIVVTILVPFLSGRFGPCVEKGTVLFLFLVGTELELDEDIMEEVAFGWTDGEGLCVLVNLDDELECAAVKSIDCKALNICFFDGFIGLLGILVLLITENVIFVFVFQALFCFFEHI